MAVKQHRGISGAPPARTERTGQKRRTRKAIVDATIQLLARGHTPSVNEVAAAADVSRRTVYLYFPRFDQLLIDATVGALSQPAVEQALAPARTRDDEERRVEHVIRAMHHVTPEIERLGRALIRLTVDADAEPSASGMPRRGYRRVEWIESALSPWRAHLDPVKWRRLVCALAMVVGWEALVVQKDVCGLTASEGEDLSVWAAQTLLRATLQDARPRGSRSTRAKMKPGSRQKR